MTVLPPEDFVGMEYDPAGPLEVITHWRVLALGFRPILEGTVGLPLQPANLHISGPSPFLFPWAFLVSYAQETTRSICPVSPCWLEDSSDWDQSPGEVAEPPPPILLWTFCPGSRLKRVEKWGLSHCTRSRASFHLGLPGHDFWVCHHLRLGPRGPGLGWVMVVSRPCGFLGAAIPCSLLHVFSESGCVTLFLSWFLWW